MFNGKKLKALSLKSRTRQGCQFSPLLFYIVLEVLALQSDKRYPDWKERDKVLIICRLNYIMYIENPKEFPQNLLDLINEFSKAIGCKISI